MTLDRIDFEIIDHLQNNALLANKVLADRVGLAPSTCLERVRRLRRDGVLTNAHYQVDPQALGIGLEAMIFVTLARHARAAVTNFMDHACTLPETKSVMHLAGEHDFLVHVAVRDAIHLRDLAMDAFTTRDDIAQIQTHLIFSRRDKWVGRLGDEGTAG